MHSDENLYKQLTDTLFQINSQIQEIMFAASVEKIDAFKLKTPEGAYVLSPLLAAKAQTLNAMSWLKATRTQVTINRPQKGRK
jgi:hypothetical protein